MTKLPEKLTAERSVIEDQDGKTVTALDRHFTANPVLGRRLAAEIARRWNAYDVMLSALKAIARCDDDGGECGNVIRFARGIVEEMIDG